VLARLFVLFTAVPLLELWLLMHVSAVVGLPTTIAMVLSTGMLGAALARREGTRALSSWQESLARGEAPKEGIASGLLILVGGIFLVTPGVLTDAAGLALLLPPIRRAFANVLVKRVGPAVQIQQFPASPFGGPSGTPGPGEEFIDVDGHFHRAENPTHDPRDAPSTPASIRGER
jgi:UPF0716 protein FxsA